MTGRAKKRSILPSWLIIRKQIRLGWFNINISKRGVGFSVGRRGMRVGRNARGEEFFEAAQDGVSVHKAKTLGSRSHKKTVHYHTDKQD